MSWGSLYYYKVDTQNPPQMKKKRDHSAPWLDITVASPTTYYNQLPQHALCTIPSSLFKQQHYTTSLNNKLQTVEDMLFPDNLLQLPQSFRANEGKDRRHKFSAVGRELFLHAYLSLAVKSTQVHFDSNSLWHALINDTVSSDMS